MVFCKYILWHFWAFQENPLACYQWCSSSVWHIRCTQCHCETNTGCLILEYFGALHHLCFIWLCSLLRVEHSIFVHKLWYGCRLLWLPDLNACLLCEGPLQWEALQAAVHTGGRLSGVVMHSLSGTEETSTCAWISYCSGRWRRQYLSQCPVALKTRPLIKTWCFWLLENFHCF